MSFRTWYAVCAALALAACVSAAHAGFTATLAFPMPDVSQSENLGYDILNVAGCHLAGEPGMPWLPCRSANFLIPRSQSVTTVQVKVLSKRQLPGSYYIYPTQPPIPTDGSWGEGDFVGPDADIYNSTAPFPGEPVEEGEATSSWGWKVYQVMVWPLEYIPAKREVWVYESLEISLELGPSLEADQEVLPRSHELQEEWAAELAQAVVNPEEIGPQAPGVLGPVPISRRWVLILPGDPEREGRDRWIDTFEPLRAHRENQGLDTEVIYVKQITEASGEAAVQAIRAYLQDQHANHGARWACLVGDHEMIPWTYQPAYSPPNDWCYCDLDGTWPGDIDWYPELWVGRAPCLTAAEGANFVGKVLAYEQNPGNGDHEYLFRSLYEYADEGQRMGTCDQLATLDDPAIQATVWGELPSYNDPNPYFPWDYHVVETLSQVHYNCFVVHCHGFTDLYWPLSIGNGQNAVPGSSFGVNDVQALTNEGYYFFWYSISCCNARLDDPSGIRSIAEAATCMFPARGAFAFAGNTRAGYWGDSSQLNYHAWGVLYPQGPLTPNYFNHAGGVEAVSKLRSWQQAQPSNSYVRYSHNLFGDPAAPIWAPRAMPPAPRPVGGETGARTPGVLVLSWGPSPVVSGRGMVRLRLDQPARLRVGLYDLQGRLVWRLHEGWVESGEHEVPWIAPGLPAGAYAIRVVAGETVLSRRIVICN
ncbi:hypothetical protein JXA88_07355 [Candidatus Fermentibacteria bacterium]|nr:hypothetical protein [Candidatus Fermentibacteria bacterium]